MRRKGKRKRKKVKRKKVKRKKKESVEVMSGYFCWSWTVQRTRVMTTASTELSAIPAAARSSPTPWKNIQLQHHTLNIYKIFSIT